LKSSAVVTPHHLSAEAGKQIIQQGGNAVDAAVAAVAAQGVVAPETSGVGGDLFALIHSPGSGKPRALNSSGRAGSGASAAALRNTGATDVPGDHPAAVTIPGCVDGMIALVSELGYLDIAQVLAPAIALAADGFEVSTEQAGAFDRQASKYRDNPAVSCFYPNGETVKRGDRVKRIDLAETLQAVANGDRDAFYLGRAGKDISAAVGGMITMDDLEEVQANWIEPIGVEVAGLTAWTIPPNSQGYLGPGTLAVLEMLGPPNDPTDPDWWHFLIESYRCLAWERNDLVSDPETAALPAHMLFDHERLSRAAESVDRHRTGIWPTPMGSPSSTAYLCTADSEGTAVSIIQSNYRGTGSPFGAARSGFLLQDRGMGFSLTPGHPNELAPGKRPLHTLSPTLWTDGNQPRWTLGTRGGAVQPQLVAQLGARVILGKVPLDQAQVAPRWSIAEFGPSSPSQLAFEPEVPDGIVNDLRKRGHSITLLDRPQPGWGPMSVIELDDAQLRAAADPRVDTTAAFVF
jgi:gamma-glutamyltranspeptidase / glutathione hydrolase